MGLGREGRVGKGGTAPWRHGYSHARWGGSRRVRACQGVRSCMGAVWCVVVFCHYRSRKQPPPRPHITLSCGVRVRPHACAVRQRTPSGSGRSRRGGAGECGCRIRGTDGARRRRRPAAARPPVRRAAALRLGCTTAAGETHGQHVSVQGIGDQCLHSLPCIGAETLLVSPVRLVKMTARPPGPHLPATNLVLRRPHASPTSACRAG